MPAPPFSDEEKRGVYRAIHERRDVRGQFLADPIPAEVLGRILNAAHHAPSVGFMQPWDFIVIEDANVRRAVYDNFERANRGAAAIYEGEKRESYLRMKLAGILDAPINICITCDREREWGRGLGRQTDSATALYSTVCAVQNLWLAARAEGIGVGWVSILKSEVIQRILAIPDHVSVVGYMCIGYPVEFAERPLLETVGWLPRISLSALVFGNRWNGSPDNELTSALRDLDEIAGGENSKDQADD